MNDDFDETMVTPILAPKLSDAKAETTIVLVVFQGKDIGKKYSLTSGENILGRASTCSVPLLAEGVSREHAMIVLDRGSVILKDLDSTNGTFVNDQKVGRVALKNGDFIKVGDIVLKFISGGAIETEFLDDMYDLTTLDPLTQVFNKRYFLATLDDELQRSRRYGRSLAVVMFDLDHFKKVNDTYGHQAGDSVLKVLAKIVSEGVRSCDIFCRYGGEEFGIILPETSIEEALQVCEKIRGLVEVNVFKHGEKIIPVTISLGLAGTQTEEPCPERAELIALADGKLYEAKHRGRNRVCY
ncbi:MAG: GGDEF domain-containing protein [Myxococcota bacterium]|nr:GGDEF domain-containing protein [Myxococcota bacterium]